jgi:glycosyltransferase involved in cell wall biosynthesis
MPKVSVLIPTFNSAEYVGEAIQSVLDQTFRDFEIIISDNASADNTEEIVKKFRDPRIGYFRSNVNVEMGINWNRCLVLAKGRYVALLCADDIWLPLFLEKSVEILETYPGIGLVFANHLFLTNNLEWPRKRLITAGPHYHFTKIIIEKNPIPISASLIRRGCYDEIGEFKPYYTADYDMWLRLSRTKWGIYYLDTPLLKYRLHESNLAKDEYRMADYTIRILESYRFEEEIERAKRKVLARLFIRRALTTKISSSLDEFLADFRVAIGYSTRQAILSLFFLGVKKSIPQSAYLALKMANHLLLNKDGVFWYGLREFIINGLKAWQKWREGKGRIS